MAEFFSHAMWQTLISIPESWDGKWFPQNESAGV
jgi:hypothetical protein